MPSHGTASILPKLHSTAKSSPISLPHRPPTHLQSYESHLERPTAPGWVQHLPIQHTQSPDWGSNSSSTSRPPTIHHPAAGTMEQWCLHHLHPASTHKPFRHCNYSIIQHHDSTAHTFTHFMCTLTTTWNQITLNQSIWGFHLGGTLRASTLT